jgi:two-component system nitrate/nitrite response regulator NarL
MVRSSKSGKAVRILIADDHPIFRDGLRRLLEDEPGLRVVGEAFDGAEAVRLARQLRPDVLLLDLAMPRVSGMEALRKLSGTRSSLRIILLTAAIAEREVVQALALGVHGLVMKSQTTPLLFRCIRCVMAGQYWVKGQAMADPAGYLRRPPAAFGPPGNTFGLTARELEVVSAIQAGNTNKDIARMLSISEQTVKHHLTNIFDKIGVSNRLELALFTLHRSTSNEAEL